MVSVSPADELNHRGRRVTQGKTVEKSPMHSRLKILRFSRLGATDRGFAACPFWENVVEVSPLPLDHWNHGFWRDFAK
jgi:hypothetical protein